jgi:periplasmic copper chaperone A
MMRRSLRTVLVIGAVSAIAVLGFAGAASAHVTVDPSEAPQGGYTKIAFRVPDESDTASTTKLDVYLPTDQPVASVLVQPVSGWTARLTTTKLPKPITTDDGDEVTKAISQITWTADSVDTAVKPGQFQEFPVSLGPLPKSDSMTFKVLQTYSDGTVVRWIDLSTPGQPEPDHPAPVLKLMPASDAPAAPGGSTPSVGAAPATSAAAGSDSGSNAAPLTISIIAAVLALAGLAVAVMAYKRGRAAA